MYIYERVGGGRGISPTGFVGSGGTEPTSVAVNSTTAYVVNHSSNNLAAFDITTPSAPVLLGTVGTDVDPYRVAVSGTTVYVVNQGSNTLQTFSFLAGPSRVVTVNPDGSLASLPLNFVQTQSATTQTGSFNLSGNGYLGGRVGIGTTGPVEKLEVVGNIKISGGGNGLTFADGTTQTTASTTASSTTNLTGDISSTGPATTYNNVVPAAKGGAGTVSGLLKADGAGLVSAAVAGTDYAAPTGSAAYIQNTTALQAASAFNVSGAGTVGGLLSAGSATVSGSVGLGTTAPSQKLDVRGNLRLGDDGNGVGTGQAIEWVGPGVSSDPVGIYRVNPAADQSELRVVVGDVADANDKFVVGRMGGTSSEGGIPTGTFTPTFSVRSDGNVGVGTGTPTSTLQVAGSVAASIRTLNSGTLAATDYTVIVIGNVSLPAPDATNTGRLYHLINGTANTYSVTGTFRDAGSGGTLGSFTLGTTSGTRGITVQSDGTQWWILTRE
jgi:hypothetical protein